MYDYLLVLFNIEFFWQWSEMPISIKSVRHTHWSNRMSLLQTMSRDHSNSNFYWLFMFMP